MDIDSQISFEAEASHAQQLQATWSAESAVCDLRAPRLTTFTKLNYQSKFDDPYQQLLYK